MLQDVVDHPAKAPTRRTAGGGWQRDRFHGNMRGLCRGTEGLGIGDAMMWSRTLFETARATGLPLVIAAKPFGRLRCGAAEHLLVFDALRFGNAQRKYGWVEPDHSVAAGLWVVQARLHRDLLPVFRRAGQNGGIAEPWAAGRLSGNPPTLLRRIQSVVEWAQPTALPFLVADRCDDQ